eukprot:CAMPEP_0201511258 /NCGR_PEP_ID=MMETSP0161_2-20130828/3728_1 /ASSEMBLY_ACC=CAM_ASM_000251 /TAXON_ID=180227 /ORGANISM="Neoparamoeba aestuarina, Strain SoJaBio B1-5/56/2" /LENGTH=224 /DNA_ID=CAMNT_0047906673 /DNA_START=169 /DNA_END=840 /DNA_ORIENTATION=+
MNSRQKEKEEGEETEKQEQQQEEQQQQREKETGKKTKPLSQKKSAVKARRQRERKKLLTEQRFNSQQVRIQCLEEGVKEAERRLHEEEQKRSYREKNKHLAMMVLVEKNRRLEAEVARQQEEIDRLSELCQREVKLWNGSFNMCERKRHIKNNNLRRQIALQMYDHLTIKKERRPEEAFERIRNIFGILPNTLNHWLTPETSTSLAHTTSPRLGPVAESWHIDE